VRQLGSLGTARSRRGPPLAPQVRGSTHSSSVYRLPAPLSQRRLNNPCKSCPGVQPGDSNRVGSR
jgi:hypothetical protein